MSTTTFSSAVLRSFRERLAPTEGGQPERVPEPFGQQPIHTLYGGAHLFRQGTVAKQADIARSALATYAPSPRSFAETFGLEPSLAEDVRARLSRRLAGSPVDDLRIDFEDGYGVRSDAEEDSHATAVGACLAESEREGALPPFVGIRIKAFGQREGRSLRTLDLCLTEFVRAGRAPLPKGFVVTLPKVERAEEVEVLSRALAELERALGIGREIPIELMVESPASLSMPTGEWMLPRLIGAASGRCRGVHFGVYDYLSSLGVAARDQRMTHPLCDLARHDILRSLFGSSVWISDGVTNVLPVARHRGATLSDKEREENRTDVHAAWRLHAADIRHALSFGIHQGWDVHPAQLVSRYAAVYAYYRQALPLATKRFSAFLGALLTATRVGSVFDDAATGRGLLSFFARGWKAGAIDDSECEALGLSPSMLQSPNLDDLVVRHGVASPEEPLFRRQEGV